MKGTCYKSFVYPSKKPYNLNNAVECLKTIAGATLNNKTQYEFLMIEDDEAKFLNALFDELFPICRSITGKGIEESLDLVQKHIPLSLDKVQSGTKVFDWEVPPQWNFKRARLWGPNNRLICDSDINNLHVVNYSIPIDGYFSLEDLKPHLHSLPTQPEAIPYVTSYYQRNWGFCLPDLQRARLKPGRYRVLIESEFDHNGGVPFGQTKIEGESEREILLSSYLCHPSLANNELSGPLVLIGLYNRIKGWSKRRFSYRFLLNPETIGSLCFLYKNHDMLAKNLEAGMILTCMGGNVEKLRYKASRRGDSIFDQLSRHLNSRGELRYIDFNPIHGSDERQYCSPGFNLPMGQISRSLNVSGVPYHTSLDNKESMDMARVTQSIDELEHFLVLAEIAGCAVNQCPFGEPQLGKRGLYPNLNSPSDTNRSDDALADGRHKLNSILTILNCSDGEQSMVSIAESLGVSLDSLAKVIYELEDNGLISYNQNQNV